MKRSRIMPFTDESAKKFISTFESVGTQHSKFQVWSDFVTMSACSISNACDKSFFDHREKMYLECSGRYSREDLDKICSLFAYTVMALDYDPDRDFLGEIFMGLNLGDGRNGQFFTPYHISSLMSRLTLDIDEIKNSDRPISISDLACGAGCLLIAAASYLKEKGINYQQKVEFVAQDIDPLVAKMCYIQLSLLGCNAVVKIGNSLSDPITENEAPSDSIWRTPIHCYSHLFKRSA